MQALMASVAGLDPLQTLARATVQKFEGERKGDLLMRALGKASRLTGAAAGIVGAVALAIFGLITPQTSQAAVANPQAIGRRSKHKAQFGLCQANSA